MMTDLATHPGNPVDEWPLFGLTDDIRPALRAELHGDHPVALVTLYASEGGAPRGVGAQMLVSRDGAYGYLSGGCVEADIALHGRAVIADGEPRHLVYGRGGPIDIRLPCGGRIEVLVERVLPDDPSAAGLLARFERREPALWLTNGRERACIAEGDLAYISLDPYRFGRRCLPRPRLIVFGKDPTALALCILATQAGAEVFLDRPNGPTAAPPFPVRYLRAQPAEALAAIGPDPWTAIVVALHDEIHDHAALAAALPSPASYVGLLGSSRYLPQKRARLADAGLAEGDIARLKAPIGLPLGGRAPWDIATAIYAEIVQSTHAGQRDLVIDLRTVAEDAEAAPLPRTPARLAHAAGM